MAGNRIRKELTKETEWKLYIMHKIINDESFLSLTTLVVRIRNLSAHVHVIDSPTCHGEPLLIQGCMEEGISQ